MSHRPSYFLLSAWTLAISLGVISVRANIRAKLCGANFFAMNFVAAINAVNVLAWKLLAVFFWILNSTKRGSAC